MFNIKCRESSELLSKSLDNPLTFAERIKLKLHLITCQACRNFENQLNVINKLSSDVKLSEEAKEKIKKKIDEMD